jgi:hypothetical protein
MVALAFHGVPDDPKMDVNHKNGVKSDNRAENLEWMTRSQNKKHAHDVLGINPWNEGLRCPGISDKSHEVMFANRKAERRVLLDMHKRFINNGWSTAELAAFWGKSRKAMWSRLRKARWEDSASEQG